jgi:hypothetical protein
MLKFKITATELARKLDGLHPATNYRSRRLPGAPPINADQVEAWRDFALLNLSNPDAIAEALRRDAEFEANPSLGMSLEESEQRIASR